MKLKVHTVIFRAFVPKPGDASQSVRTLDAKTDGEMIYEDGLLRVDSPKGKVVYPEANIASMIVMPEAAPKTRKKKSNDAEAVSR